jgi:nucleotide-binding universal stress UspA family protein
MTTQSSESASNAAPTSYRILIAVAFEPTAHAPIAEGMRLATRTPGAELHVVHAVSKPSSLNSEATPVATASLMEAARLKDAAERLRMRLDVEWRQTGEFGVIAHVRQGDAAQVVLQVAVDIDADVIVVGSHRRTGIRKLMLGSVAERILHESHCPVLVAVAKDYSGTTATARIEPPCADCLSTRKQTGNTKFWCERHSRTHLEPHIYVPRDQARSSVFPTY